MTSYLAAVGFKQCKNAIISTNKYETRLDLNIIQSTLVISKLKGPSETLPDIRTSTYQIFRIEEKTNGPTKFHKLDSFS